MVNIFDKFLYTVFCVSSPTKIKPYHDTVFTLLCYE